MPPERRQPQKSRQLPFKPPRPRVASSNAEPSNQTSSKPNTKAKNNNTTKASSSSSSSKRPRNSTSSRQKPSESPEPSTASASEQEPVPGSGTRRHSRENSLSSGEPDYVLAEVITSNKANDNVTSSEPRIPPKLLTTLLHHHFKNGKTKIAKDANNVVAKYVDVFVRESLARAAFERNESEGDANSGGGRTVGDGFLEVEDLEKMAPQLLLDF